VTEELVGRSEAIFVFDRDNHARMLALFPDAEDRLHFVGALDAGGPLYVADPWGRGADAYATGYRRIAEALSSSVMR
jgi:protein-tyrosine-phosphatase